MHSTLKAIYCIPFLALLWLTSCNGLSNKPNEQSDESVTKLIDEARSLVAGHPDSAINKLVTLLDTAVVSPKNKCEASLIIGHGLSVKFDLDKSDSILNKALSTSAAIKDTLVQIQLNNLLGVNQSKRGNYDLSTRYYKTAEELAHGRTDADKYLININNNMGIIAKSTGKMDSAKYYYQRAMEYAIKLGDKSGEALSLINIGTIFSVYGEYDKQAANLRKAITLYTDSNNMGTLVATMNLSGALQGEQKLDSALIELRNAERLALKINTPRHLSQIYYNEGGVYYQMKEYAKSITYINKSLEIKKNLNDSVGMTYNLCALSGSYAELKQYDKAIGSALEALRLAKRFENELLWPSYDNLYVAYSQKGDWQNAAKTLEDRIVVKDSLFSKQKYEAIQELQTKYETEQKEKDILAASQTIRLQRITTLLLIVLCISVITVSSIILRNQRKKLENHINILKQNEVLSTLANSLVEKDIVQSNGTDNDEKSDELITRLNRLFKEENIYRTQGLTINSVADVLNTNRDYLSKALNQRLQKNFNEYINFFRIEEAKLILKSQCDGGYSTYTMQTIAEEVGFTGTSTFYTAFKQVVGLTPSEYKRTVKHIKK